MDRYVASEKEYLRFWRARGSDRCIVQITLTEITICIVPVPHGADLQELNDIPGIVQASVGSRFSTPPSHGYCPAWVPPFVEVVDIRILIVRLWSPIFLDYLLPSVVTLSRDK